MTDEIKYKESQLQKYMKSNDLEGILFSTREFFSWITGGGVNYIVEATELGVVDLLITKEKKYCIANKFERFRIMEEELAGLEYEIVEFDWWGTGLDSQNMVRGIMNGKRFGADTNFPGGINLYKELKKLRYSLRPEEVKRYRKSAVATANALEDTCRSVQPGMTEFQVLGILMKNTMEKGIEPAVALVASDDRIAKYRHPIAKEKKIDKYVLVVICGRKEGLITSCSRFVHFGEPPARIRDIHSKIVRVDAEYITNTVVGNKVSDVFKTGMEMYKEIGYDNEWQFLHQGGPTGYSNRDYFGAPDVDGLVLPNQAYAWNPTVPGIKSEDTIIATNEGTDIISITGKWPMVNVKAKNGIIVERADILVL